MSEAVPAVILLDWHQTLSVSRFWGPWLDSDDPSRREVAVRMAESLFGEPSSQLDPWCRGALSAEQVVHTVAVQAGLDPLLVMEGLEASCRGMQLLSDKTLPKVDVLRGRGVRVRIATDNMDTFSRWTVPAMGLSRWFDPADLGAVKNAPLDDRGRHPFFSDLLDGLEPGARVYLVDDGHATASAVEPLGITFCHVTPDCDVVAWLDLLAEEWLRQDDAPFGQRHVTRTTSTHASRVQACFLRSKAAIGPPSID